MVGLSAFSHESFIPLQLGFPASYILALPSIFDWTTQNLGFRQSNNRLRLLVGFFEGAGAGLLTLVNVSSVWKLLFLTSIGLGTLFVGFFGRKFTQATSVSLVPNVCD
jgi:hypothetical protein